MATDFYIDGKEFVPLPGILTDMEDMDGAEVKDAPEYYFKVVVATVPQSWLTVLIRPEAENLTTIRVANNGSELALGYVKIETEKNIYEKPIALSPGKSATFVLPENVAKIEKRV